MPPSRAHRWAVLAAVIAIGLIAGLGAARADEDRLRKMSQRAMEAYDLLEYEEAREILSDAIVFAKRNRLGNSSVTAQVHLNLGIVFFSGIQDENAAAIEFVNALEIDPKIQIPAAYRTQKMQSLLDDIRGDIAVGAEGGAGGGCAGVTGVQHALITETPAGQSRTVGAEVSPGVGAGRVMLYYRDQDSTEFSSVEMQPVSDCTFRAEIPASGVRGEYLYYYIAAERRGKAVASSGSAGTPNIIEVREVAAVENPLGGSEPEEPEPSSPSGGGGHSIFISIAAGSGGGYVTGSTEQAQDEVACCFAPALLHVLPEIGFFINPKTTLSAAARIGFPLGADLRGHAVVAPGGLLRLRYAPSGAGAGAFFSFLVGGGVMRNVVPMVEPRNGGTKDTVASGPLFAGAGMGYGFAFGKNLSLVGEVNSIAGIPVVNCLGNCGPLGRGVEPNFAVQIDANLGLVISF